MKEFWKDLLSETVEQPELGFLVVFAMFAVILLILDMIISFIANPELGIACLYWFFLVFLTWKILQKIAQHLLEKDIDNK